MFKIVGGKHSGKNVVLYSFMRWSVRCSCNRRQERLRKTKFITLTGARHRRHHTPCRATWENTNLIRRQKTEERECLGRSLTGVSPGKARHGRVNSVGLTSLSNSSGLWVIGVVSR